MDKKDFAAFSEAMVQLGVLYRHPMEAFLVEMYWEALQRFHFRDIARALRAHIQNPDTGQFFPKPADVVRFLEGSSRTQALQAWTKVVEAVRCYGGYTSVVFDDPLIHAVIRDMSGWTTLCEVTVEELPFCAKDFQARFEGYVGHPPGHYPHVLAGRLTDPSDIPVFIGNIAKAQALYQQGTGSLTPTTGEQP